MMKKKKKKNRSKHKTGSITKYREEKMANPSQVHLFPKPPAGSVRSRQFRISGWGVKSRWLLSHMRYVVQLSFWEKLMRYSWTVILTCALGCESFFFFFFIMTAIPGSCHTLGRLPSEQSVTSENCALTMTPVERPSAPWPRLEKSMRGAKWGTTNSNLFLYQLCVNTDGSQGGEMSWGSAMFAGLELLPPPTHTHFVHHVISDSLCGPAVRLGWREIPVHCHQVYILVKSGPVFVGLCSTIPLQPFKQTPDGCVIRNLVCWSTASDLLPERVQQGSTACEGNLSGSSRGLSATWVHFIRGPTGESYPTSPDCNKVKKEYKNKVDSG